MHITSWQAYLWNGEWSTFGTKHIKGRGGKKTAQFKFVGKLWLDNSKTAISNIRCNPAHPTKMALVFLGHKQPQSASRGIRKNRWAVLKAPAFLRGLAGNLEGVVSPSPSLVSTSFSHREEWELHPGRRSGRQMLICHCMETGQRNADG